MCLGAREDYKVSYTYIAAPVACDTSLSPLEEVVVIMPCLDHDSVGTLAFLPMQFRLSVFYAVCHKFKG